MLLFVLNKAGLVQSHLAQPAGAEVAAVLVPARDDNTLNQGGGDGDGEEWLDQRDVLKMEPRGFAGRLDWGKGC